LLASYTLGGIVGELVCAPVSIEEMLGTSILASTAVYQPRVNVTSFVSYQALPK